MRLCVTDMMRSMGLHLQPFDYAAHTDDVGVEWRKWMRSFEVMTRASRIKDEDWKFDLLLHYAGPGVQHLFETLPELPGIEKRGPITNGDQYVPNMTHYEEAVAKLNSFFLPKENTTYERHLLRQMKQKAGENIDMFTIRLRIQADRCGFGSNLEENIKDQIIQNCQSAGLRRDLLKRGDAALSEILKVAKIFETVAQQEKSFTNISDQKLPMAEVNKIDLKPSYGNRKWSNESNRQECNRCGYTGHMANDEKCPAKGKTCNKCGNRDHFARKCRKRQSSRQFNNNDNVHRAKVSKFSKTENESAPKSEYTVKQVIADEEYVFNVTAGDDSSEVQGEIGGITLTMVIDSGSKYNLLSESTWKELKLKGVAVSNQRETTNKVFKAYGGHELPQLGVFAAEIAIGKCRKLADFYVICGVGKVLIGRDTAIEMDILKINIAVNEIDTKAEGHHLEKIKNVVVDIPIKADAKPVIQPYRRIPVALEKAVDDKIDELLSQGVIEKVNEPSKWVSPVVVVPKGNDVRICLDMRRANEAVERENHPLPTIEDFLPHLGKAKVFSRLDVKNAFHQVQ